ncbi:hypothetical protein DXC97_02550 [Lachnospiraceae bacterium TF09-5]|nr:hypothetical protein DXC97_02550 [Lachnospiraceae bacterium TF09-5]
MTREKLEEYKSKKDEIHELQQKLQHLGEGDSLIGNDVILDYQTGYPRPQSIVGYDYLKEQHLKNKWQHNLDKLTVECIEVELWIEEIPDSLTRRIFRMRYIDGKSQEEVGKAVHMSQSNVSRKIENYINLHKMHKKV